MDSSETLFAVELSHIRAEIAQSHTVDQLRTQFDRLKALRFEHRDDFDFLVAISDLQNEAVERARELQQPSVNLNGISTPGSAGAPERLEQAAEISPDVERLDPKAWQRVVYLGLFFGLILFAAFFYLIQTARRLNLTPAETAQISGAAPQSKPVGQAGIPVQAPQAGKPTVRLYTDLVPGTVTIDGGEPQDLKDGELILDNLQPGQHSMRVTGNGGSAEFSYDVSENEAPKLIGLPTASNAMAVLVSAQEGKARLVANGDESDVAIDSNPAGRAAAEGLTLENLGKVDHLLQVTQGRDRQRFVLTYTPAPTLTVYVKSDPNAGTVVVLAKQDGADVFINDTLYRRKTEAGQIRIPLKVGDYTIRVHKAGFLDPPPQQVTVKKGEETAANFRLEPLPQVATLDIRGALPGTMVFIDRDFAATVNNDGSISISNVKAGEHSVELRRDQALPKHFEHTFKTGETVTLSGPDVTLEKVVVQNAPAPATTPAAPALPNPYTAQNSNVQIEGPQIHRGGGFVSYNVPRVPGHYSFAGQTRKTGFLRHSKLQWFAGYQDSENYILFTVDGKHAAVREIRNGQATELNRIPFSTDNDTWVQVDMVVKAGSITAHIKTPDTPWQMLAFVPSPGRDLTQDHVGLYVPGNDEVAVANFRFSAR